MIHTPPLTRTLISSSSVPRCKSCSLKVPLSPRYLETRSRRQTWKQMNTHFGYHPHLCCHYLFSYHLQTTFAPASDPSQSHGSKTAGGEHSRATITQRASYFSSHFEVLKVRAGGAECQSNLLCSASLLISFFFFSSFLVIPSFRVFLTWHVKIKTHNLLIPLTSIISNSSIIHPRVSFLQQLQRCGSITSFTSSVHMVQPSIVQTHRTCGWILHFVIPACDCNSTQDFHQTVGTIQ